MEFRRITGLPPYVFTIIDGLKIEARRAGQDVVDLGFGNPDLPSPQVAVDKLAEAATVAPGVERTWAGQVLIGRTVADAEAKLASHGDRPGLVWGTVEHLRAHVDTLAAAGATWAVCAPIDIGTDPDVVELLAELC